MKQVKITQLVPDPNNANKGTVRGAAQLETSLRKFGAGRSILVDKNGLVIAGNKTVENAAAIGLDDVIIVKTDGKKLVAVQRTDLDLDDPSTGARALAYADNRVSEIDLEWDTEQILQDISAGVDLSDFFTDEELTAVVGDVSNVEFPEYDESVADEVEYCECPKCGHKWAK